MQSGLSLHLPEASSIAPGVDHLFFFLVMVAVVSTALIFLVILIFMIKYRRRSPDERPKAIQNFIPLQVLWTAIPMGILAVVFVWSSSLYVHSAQAPRGSLEIFVTGKQWMWKMEHPTGQREIDELHIPVGMPVKLTMTSEDVIHDFDVPAFRLKQDVLPGRYTSLWFEATRTGTFPLYCGEYCGAFHSSMTGSIVVMTPGAYEQWLGGGAPGETMEAAGRRLFAQHGCTSCHVANGSGLGPSLLGVYGHPVHLSDGETLVADDAYLRDCILTSLGGKVVAGYPHLMTPFKGQLTEQEVLDLIAYIHSLGNQPHPQKGKP